MLYRQIEFLEIIQELFRIDFSLSLFIVGRTFVKSTMILLSTLQYLTSQKIKDAGILFQKRRNNGSIYLMGYALEFTLKRKISVTFGFTNGFPETGAELNSYSSQINLFHSLNTGIQLNRIVQLRHHRLNELLTYSGERARILALFYPEWQTVSAWNPEDRYVRQRITRRRTVEFMHSARLILREIA